MLVKAVQAFRASFQAQLFQKVLETGSSSHLRRSFRNLRASTCVPFRTYTFDFRFTRAQSRNL